MDNLVRNLKIVWRTEAIIAENRARLVSRQIGLMAFAGLISVFGLAMLDVSAFYELQPRIGPSLAALIVAAANFVIALVLFLYAASVKEGPEIVPAREVRDMALKELETEASAAQAEISKLRDEIKGVAEGARSFAKDPFGTLAPQLLMPLVAAAVKALRSKK